MDKCSHPYKPGPLITKKTPSCRHRDPHNEPKLFWRPSQVYNGNPYTNKTASSYCMMTSSNGGIFRVTGLLCGEFTGPQRPVTRTFDIFFDMCLNKQLRKQSRRWLFETPSRPVWRHCNGIEAQYWVNLAPSQHVYPTHDYHPATLALHWRMAKPLRDLHEDHDPVSHSVVFWF